MAPARIQCGWCGQPASRTACGHCGRDPVLPWAQRAQEPPEIRTDAAGRPVLDDRTIRRRLAEARIAIEEAGGTVTVEALAEHLDVAPRTVRRWRDRLGGH